MTTIHYPCDTAAVFDNVVYPIHLERPEQIEQEIQGAVNWFCWWCNVEKAVVKASMLISFGGAYLSHKQAMEKSLCAA